MKENFDYIIAGSGMAGLSLLYHLLQDEVLSKKDIVVIDPVNKNTNDRTWCFWEKEPGPFDAIVCQQWQTLQFFSHDVSREFKMKEYRYKMIQSGDFYAHVLKEVEKYSNVVFRNEKIAAIEEKGNKAVVTTDAGEYTGTYVFNSTGLFHPVMNKENTLLQHFMGWFIKSSTPVFNSEIGTLMDFRLNQQHGTTFMYVLPTSSTEALVEYTLFSPETLKEEDYISELEKYISERLQISEYEITHKEFGVIPMSKARFKRYLGEEKRIINLGTAGGFTKPSTGYTFQFVQKHVANVVNRLKKNQSPAVGPSLHEKMFHWYDMTLLDVLLTNKLSGEQIFSSLFGKVAPESILAFLANESNFWEELKIRNSVPVLPFVTSGMKQFLPGKP
ncbi:MAG: lycopene cyclase [Bacteroidetes bacterium]|nr:MAG: lycopene cyclase [Bacteroidota bacterium]